MPQYVVFLRAINVSGRFIKMVALAEHFRALGHANARTFINSGNVLIQSRQTSDARLGASIEEGLEPLLGFRSEVFVRSVPQLQAIAAQAQALRELHPSVSPWIKRSSHPKYITLVTEPHANTCTSWTCSLPNTHG